MKKFKNFLIENQEINAYEVRKFLKHDNFQIVNNKINVNQNVDLGNKDLKSIPFPFGIVKEYFSCRENQLTSLKNCPEIVDGNFYCSYNQLSSLQYCPKEVNGTFYCINNQITSLKYCSNKIGGFFYCYNNPLVDISDIIDKEIKELNCDFDKLNVTVCNLKALKQTDNINKVNWYLDTDSEEELQLYAIKVNPENIRKIPDILDSIIEMIKRGYPELIRYLPYDKQTKLTRYGL